MTFLPDQTERTTADSTANGHHADALICPLPPVLPALSHPTTSMQLLQDGGCPLAVPVSERLRFEAFLAELSATFVNASADQVDAAIVSALQQIVDFLGIDRSGFGELLGDQMVITHSYELPGVPPAPRVILEGHFPNYARMVRAGEAFRIPDDLPADAIVEREYLARAGPKSNLTIPLRVAGAVVGGIGFASFRLAIDWPEDLVRRLRLVGDIFTNALARKRADEALRTLAARLLNAQEEERRRVAREMHDDWTQRLAVMGLDLAKLEQHIGDPEMARPLLQTTRMQLISLSEDMHALSRQLHPSIIDDLGLVEALRSECASFSRREGITIAYHTTGVPRTISRDVALCIYRVAQEGLRNLAKHAAVTQGWVTLVVEDGELVLCVRDEGVGFDLSEAHHEPRLGLASMEERVRLIRARLSITSTLGRGTLVEVRASLMENHS